MKPKLPKAKPSAGSGRGSGAGRGRQHLIAGIACVENTPRRAGGLTFRVIIACMEKLAASKFTDAITNCMRGASRSPTNFSRPAVSV